jgi:hypothetical protein
LLQYVEHLAAVEYLPFVDGSHFPVEVLHSYLVLVGGIGLLQDVEHLAAVEYLPFVDGSHFPVEVLHSYLVLVGCRWRYKYTINPQIAITAIMLSDTEIIIVRESGIYRNTR